uniref:Prepilin-type N-terminal cleavage/methylation domain-containing protein n=1 Tax=Ammonifex degensii TaxID=42838 RepID=A0A7C1F348_9THEO
MKQGHFQEEGLTLVEVIIAATLTTLILCGAFLLYERGVRDWAWTEQQTDVVDNLRVAAERVASELREARGIDLPDEESPTTDYLQFTNGSGQTVIYRFDSVQGELERSVNGGVYQPIASRIKEVKFFRLTETVEDEDGNMDVVAKPVVEIKLTGKGRKGNEVTVRTAACARLLSE